MFEALQSVGENVAGDPFLRSEQLGELALALEEKVPQHQKGPLVAKDVERGADRAVGSPADCTHAQSLAESLAKRERSGLASRQ